MAVVSKIVFTGMEVVRVPVEKKDLVVRIQDFYLVQPLEDPIDLDDDANTVAPVIFVDP